MADTARFIRASLELSIQPVC